MTDQTTTEVARVLSEHRPEETSYDAGWLEGCHCGGWEVSTPTWDTDNAASWAAYHAHVADELSKAGLLRPQDAAQTPQDGANGGDVGSGKGEGVSTPQTGAQAPGGGEA